jgi:hypothetical protein
MARWTSRAPSQAEHTTDKVQRIPVPVTEGPGLGGRCVGRGRGHACLALGNATD